MEKRRWAMAAGLIGPSLVLHKLMWEGFAHGDTMPALLGIAVLSWALISIAAWCVLWAFERGTMWWNGITSIETLQPGAWRVSHDWRGLPEVAWRENMKAMALRCAVQLEFDGLQFAFTNVDDVCPEERRLVEGGGWGAARALWARFLERPVGVRSTSGAWQALTAFEVSDEARVFGHRVRDRAGQPLGEPRTVLLAHFSDQSRPVELSCGFFRVDDLAQLQRVLTRVFIEERADVLQRLETVGRETRAPAPAPEKL